MRSSRRGRGDGDEHGVRSILSHQPRREGGKSVWFKQSEDSSDIEVEIIPDTVGRVEEETEEELEVEMEEVVRDPAAPMRGPEDALQSERMQTGEEQNPTEPGSDQGEVGQEER